MQAQQRQGMRRAVIGLGVASAVLVSGCAADDPNRRAKTGAAIGALVGAVAGHQVDGDKGRYVGAAVGALAGAAVGNYQDKQAAELERELAAEQARGELQILFVDLGRCEHRLVVVNWGERGGR